MWLRFSFYFQCKSWNSATLPVNQTLNSTALLWHFVRMAACLSLALRKARHWLSILWNAPNRMHSCMHECFQSHQQDQLTFSYLDDCRRPDILESHHVCRWPTLLACTWHCRNDYKRKSPLQCFKDMSHERNQRGQYIDAKEWSLCTAFQVNTQHGQCKMTVIVFRSGDCTPFITTWTHRMVGILPNQWSQAFQHALSYHAYHDWPKLPVRKRLMRTALIITTYCKHFNWPMNVIVCHCKEKNKATFFEVDGSQILHYFFDPLLMWWRIWCVFYVRDCRSWHIMPARFNACLQGQRGTLK